MKKITLFTFLVMLLCLASCEKEQQKFAEIRYETNIGISVNNTDPDCAQAFVGVVRNSHSGEVTEYTYQIQGDKPSTATLFFQSPVSTATHFEGSDIRYFYINSIFPNFESLKYLDGEVNLLHSGEDYLEGTFSGKFFWGKPMPGEVPDDIVDTITVTNGYFKVSVATTTQAS
ncbi:MAG: hypothetical protein KBT28_12730 [Bacteroidales bacterium]|nr:hypothetical protein [Candidatus Colimorpha merdihippi]